MNAIIQLFQACGKFSANLRPLKVERPRARKSHDLRLLDLPPAPTEHEPSRRKGIGREKVAETAGVWATLPR